MASEKLILLEDVVDLGLAGEEVSVSSGYARNFLLPKKKAVKSSPGALRQIASRKEKIEEQRKADLASAQELAKKVEETEITLSMQASDDDQLFGSVTDRMIADAYASNGITIDHNKVVLSEQIKQLGMFKIEVKLHPEVIATGKVWVVRA